MPRTLLRLLAVALVLALTLPGESTLRVFGGEPAVFEAETGSEGSSSSDLVDDVRVGHKRPRYRSHHTAELRRAAVPARDVGLRLDHAPSPRAPTPFAGPLRSGRERLTRHQSFLI